MNNKIKIFRTQKGLKQIELAQKSKINIRQLQRYESNQRQPKIEEIISMADVLEIDDIRKLFTSDNNKKLQTAATE